VNWLGDSLQVIVIAGGAFAVCITALVLVILLARRSPSFDPTYLEHIAIQANEAYRAGFEMGLRAAQAEQAEPEEREHAGVPSRREIAKGDVNAASINPALMDDYVAVMRDRSYEPSNAER